MIYIYNIYIYMYIYIHIYVNTDSFYICTRLHFGASPPASCRQSSTIPTNQVWRHASLVSMRRQQILWSLPAAGGITKKLDVWDIKQTSLGILESPCFTKLAPMKKKTDGSQNAPHFWGICIGLEVEPLAGRWAIWSSDTRWLVYSSDWGLVGV